MKERARLKQLPSQAHRYLQTVAQNIVLARKRRRWTQASLAERAGVGVATVRRLESGDVQVGLVVLANILVALNLEKTLLSLADPAEDELGLSLEKQHHPQRVREGQYGLDTDF